MTITTASACRAAIGVACTTLAVVFASVLPAQERALNRNVMVAMTDGVRLATDVYLPFRDDMFPVVLLRTPYDKRGKKWLADALVSKGYAVVVQDVRGQVASEGVFSPVVNERSDGLDTLDWIVDQEWCDGRIGMWGTSYVAFCALILAPEGHSALKTIVNMSGFGDTPGFLFPGDAMHLMLAAPWSLSGQIRGEGSFAEFDWDELFRHVPVSTMAESVGINNSVFTPSVDALEDPLLAANGSILSHLDEYRIPTLHVTGWNDFVARDTLTVYEQVRDLHPDLSQQLIVGPWRHDQVFRDDARVGDVDYGPAARMGQKKVKEIVIRWFDEHLIGEEVPEQKPVRLFVMGENEWREFDQWPPMAVEFQPWFLGSDGGANSRNGNGVLVSKPVDQNGSDSFVYNPMDPVPTTGGANFHFFLNNLGALDQSEVEVRDDVLVYTSTVCERSFDIIGPVRAEVYASTEAQSMDVTAKLVVVRKDDVAHIVTDGIRRLLEVTPGEVHRFDIDLGDTATHVPAGSRLRLEVSSSNFPKYTRNASTGERAEIATELKTAVQTIWHSPKFRSRVVLPILQ
jgi:putative CocE/NonD family hydrolase